MQGREDNTHLKIAMLCVLGVQICRIAVSHDCRDLRGPGRVVSSDVNGRLEGAISTEAAPIVRIGIVAELFRSMC